VFRMSRASLLARLPLYCSAECATPTNSSLFANFRGIWPMPLSLLNHSALALFAQRTRIPTSARSIGFCAIWVCISSSSSSRECECEYMRVLNCVFGLKLWRALVFRKKASWWLVATTSTAVPNPNKLARANKLLHLL